MNRIDTIRQACLKVQAEQMESFHQDNLQFLANLIVDIETVKANNGPDGSELSELDFN